MREPVLANWVIKSTWNVAIWPWNRRAKPKRYDKNGQFLHPLRGSHYPVQAQPCCVPRLLVTRAQAAVSRWQEGVCGSVGSWWGDRDWLPTSSLRSAAEHTVLGLQTHCFARPEGACLEESPPKGSIAAAGDCSSTNYFWSFWLLHEGCQQLLGSERQKWPFIKKFCVVFCWPDQRRSLEFFKPLKKISSTQDWY